MDLTTGPIGRLLLRLSWPVVISMILMQLLEVVDLIIVRQLHSTAATAAVGLGAFAVFLNINLIAGIGIGTTAMVARRIGERRIEEAHETIRQSMYLVGAIGLVLGAALALGAPALLNLMHASAEVQEYAIPFIRIASLSLAVTMQSVVLRGAMQGLGDTLTPTLLLVGANIVNAILDYGFVYGLWGFPKLEVAGLAVGSAVARTLMGVVLIYLLRGGRYPIWDAGGLRWKAYNYNLRFPGLRIDSQAMWAVWTIGWPTGLRGVLRSIAFLTLLGFANRTTLGDSATAAFTAGIRAEGFAFLPVVGLMTAVVSMVGQNLGAGNPERAERSAWLAVYWATGYLVVMCLIFLNWPEEILRIFIDANDPQAIHAGAMYLWLTGYFEWVLGAIVMSGALQAGGDAHYPFKVQLFGQYAIRIPLAYVLLTYTTLDSNALWIAVNVSMAFECLMVFLRFRGGRWKRIAL